MYWKKLLNWSKTPVSQKFILLEGSKVNLRTKKLEDAELDYEWRTDPEIAALDATVPINISFSNYLAHFEDEIKYPVPWSIKFAIETKGGRMIGNIMYYDIDPIDKEAEIGIIIGDKKFLGKGYGPDALKTLLNYIFDTTDMAKLYLHTLTTNKRAQKAFKKIGFIEDRKVRRDGMNFVKLDINREDWQLPG